MQIINNIANKQALKHAALKQLHRISNHKDMINSNLKS